MKLILELATKGAWIAGTGFILKQYIDEPTTLAALFASVVLPSGILVKYLCKGSVVCVLEAIELQGLRQLWENYNSGALKEALAKVLINKELEDKAEGEEIILKVEIDEWMYHEACLELIVAKVEGRISSGVLSFYPCPGA